MGEIQYFSKWQMIEVAIDEEGFRGALYTASIIRLPLKLSSVKSNGKNKVKSSGSVKWKVFVEYHNLIKEAGDKNSRKPLREYVEISQIRPKPPKCEDYTLEINKEVDAFYDDGWWKGKIIDVLDDSLYLVYFDYTGESIEIERKDLRVRVEWIGGQWVLPEELQKQQQQQQQQQQQMVISLTYVNSYQDIAFVSGNQGSLSEAVKALSRLSTHWTEFSELKRCQIEKVSHVPREEHIELLMEQREHFIDHARHMELTSDMRNPLSKKRMQETSSLQAGEQMETISVKRGRLEPPAVDTKSLTEEVLSNITIKEENPPSSLFNGRSLQLICDKGMPSSEVFPNTELAFQTNKEMMFVDELLEEQESVNSSSKISCYFELECQTNKGMTSEGALSKEPGSEKSFNMIESALNFVDLSPFSKVLDGGSSERIEVKVSSFDDPTHHGTLLEYALPFTKKSDMWEKVESKDVFQLMPQKPHFHPLRKLKDNEKICEIKALGHMITFSDLADETRRYKFEDHINDIKTTLEVLVTLEPLGFDIQKVKSQLVQLIELKNRQVVLEDRTRIVTGKIEEVNTEIGRFDAKIEEARKIIMEQEGKRQEGVSFIVQLKEQLASIENDSHTAKLSFYEVASRPW
ncbi:hypothetical protein GIB67_000370 [Kingdonia uniflora]|uniref:Agenet domain-containing protein n=1 Tax=Kingdonia uniflora TaxID=39325 RepID=A0A7J7LKI6_9MAGN|nr:hypothetical protein GIB67_000370 [Kingdonia uniflora]